MSRKLEAHVFDSTLIQDLGKANALKALELQKSAKEQEQKKKEKEKRRGRIAFLKRLSLRYNPTLALTFVGIYWFVGLKNAQFI